VIVPPVSPEPAATLVTVPEQGVIQVNPVEQEEFAARTWPSVPTVRAVGVDAAVAESRTPFAVKALQETNDGVAHLTPVVHPESTVKI
jgi:hypothetical protein